MKKTLDSQWADSSADLRSHSHIHGRRNRLRNAQGFIPDEDGRERIGAKQRDEERANLRRHFNTALMLIAAEDDRETRFRIAWELREQ